MSDVIPFSSHTAEAIATARQHSVGDLLRRTALRYPDKLAVVAGERRMSFAEFDAAVNRAAHALSARGLGKGDRLALLSHNSWQFAVLAFATAKLGVVLVPVNFMLGAEEIAYILTHSGASGIVTEDALAPTAAKALASAGLAGGVRGWIGLSGSATPAAGWEDVDDWIDGPGEAGEPGVAVGDDDPLRLMYTSGTESRPKGVMLSSRSLIGQYVSCTIDGGMSGDDVEVHSLPMYHCAQLDCFFSVDVYLGATSVILPGPDPATLLATIEREQVTKLFCPPTVWISLLRHPDFDRRDLSSLRKGYYGASPMPVEVLREMRQRLPEVALWNFYGQTEMAPLATILRPHEQLSYAGSAGRAALNVETRLVDDEDNPVPPGEVGEIVHRSPHAALGYYNDEAKTAAAFRGGWFHSGDLGVMTADGYLSVVDRKKDMIKTGGENVASREVEEALYLLEGVAEVAVFGIPHPHWIEAVTAVVVPKPGAGLSVERVHAHAREHLAGYKRPKYVVLVDALPKNPSGKILKRDLRAQHADLAADR
ncbi:acyl-CoA synthetase [Pseudonocardia asaccharolytica]|uniref:Acyl-CoA synthetase n=1 Tax=Pseudonocardia asaccharolytica DSM 44247 = NBRC 16224 TaxID=1123024 RepID=A0A511CY57_9PSEU|nr:acyl-CoA synthetase [Pseudonocardia asaccharolytica]GEL17500.1 acyl-CoA synthetase [Pseudonocardia asaccharolytica DSM 44247 = NBRC 16224]